MNSDEIQSYLYSKISDYSKKENQNKHLFQFIMYGYPFIYEGKTHWFLEHLLNTLVYIDKFVDGYSKIIIDKIASFDKKNAEQIFQTLGEVLTLFNFLNWSMTDKYSIELEPTPYRGAKNPEFRLKIGEEWFAIEVKTPDLSSFTNIRQNGVQITSRLTSEELKILKDSREIVFSKDLKIQDYLKSAEEKFSIYKSTGQYENDKTILVIIWDDFINECISALINPNSGLLTNKSFYPNSLFEHVDSVIIFRHLRHIKHLFYFGELLIYGPSDPPPSNVFDLSQYPLTTGIYIKNPHSYQGLQFDFFPMLYTMSENDNPIGFVAEYQPTDIIDWTIATGVSGLNFCSEKLRSSIISLFKSNKEFKLENSKITADLSVIALENILKDSTNDEKALEVVQRILKLNESAILSKIAKVEMDWNTINKVNVQVKKKWKKLKKGRSDRDCPCKSGEKYYQCCYRKLKYFNFTKYYAP